jgi:hypothetical protein
MGEPDRTILVKAESIRAPMRERTDHALKLRTHGGKPLVNR